MSKQKKQPPRRRNGLVEAMRKRTACQTPVAPNRKVRRQDRNSWRKEWE